MWQIFTNNGWAKLSAFLITLVLFVLVRQINYRGDAALVRKSNIAVTNLPDTLQLDPASEFVNRDVEVVVSGPAELMIEAERQTCQLTVDLSEITPGEHEIRIQPEMLSTREYLRRLPALRRAVRQFSPPVLRVSVLLATRTYPVVVDYTLDLSEELVVDATSPDTRCDPPRLEVAGGKKSLDALDAMQPPFVVRCDPITITDDSRRLPGNPEIVYMVTQLPAELAPQYPDVRPANPEILQVTAYFRLRPRGD
ncbi:hypothetical protein HS125_18255 [bacterium]|nr:hypothetical protein [bacterium]